MTVKIAAGICTYSDAKGLDRLLSTLADHVDLSIIIHGSFPNFPQDPHSLDDTLAVIKQYSKSNIWMIDMGKPQLEPISRQMYFESTYGYDFCLVIDSDEYVSDGADWDIFRGNLEIITDTQSPFYIYDVMFDGPPHHAWPRPRLFYQPWKIKYGGLHIQWILPDGKKVTSLSDSRQIIEGIRISHDISYRPESRTEARQTYRNWLAQYETPLV